MANAVVSMRVPEGAKERLERFSRSIGKKTSEAGAMLLEEGLRRLEHPYIDFRQSGLGRQAFIEGTRLAVWYVQQVASDYHFDVSKTAEHFQLPQAKMQAALHYANSFAVEIRQAQADAKATEETLPLGVLPGLKVYDTVPAK